MPRHQMPRHHGCHVTTGDALTPDELGALGGVRSLLLLKKGKNGNSESIEKGAGTRPVGIPHPLRRATESMTHRTVKDALRKVFDRFQLSYDVDYGMDMLIFRNRLFFELHDTALTVDLDMKNFFKHMVLYMS